MSTAETPLRGIFPPMVTPLTREGALDQEGTGRLVEHLIAGGVDGVFILGTTGEGPSLGADVQRQLIETTLQQVDRRVPVLVGITNTCLQESLSLAEVAADFGAFAVVASAPYYFPIGQPELLDYFRTLVDQLPLPLVLYNMPRLTKVSFEPETVRQLLDDANVIGIKDSSGDLQLAAAYVEVFAERRDWSLMTGPEEILAEAIQVGASGGVCGGANLFPRLFVDLYDAAVRNDTEQIKALQDSVLQVGQLLYSIGEHPSSTVKGVKCALSCLGLCEDHMAPPLHRFGEKERQIVKQRLESVGQLQAEGIQAVMNSDGKA